MFKSKLKKSKIIQHQDHAEVSQMLTFLPLVTINAGKLQVQEEGLQVIEDQTTGKTYLVGNEGSNKIIKKIYRCLNVNLPSENKSSGLWISNYPRYDHKANEQVFFIDMVTSNEEESAKLHVLCSLICTSLLVEVQKNKSHNHLSGLNGRVVYSSEGSESLNQKNRKQSLANIVFYQYLFGPFDTALLIKTDQEITAMLQKQGMQDQCNTCRSYYDNLFGLGLSNNQMANNNQDYLIRLENQLKRIVKGHTVMEEDLFCGPILRQYIECLVDSLNRRGMVDIKQSIQSIAVSDGYNGYLRAVQYYHTALGRQLTEEGNPNLQETLQITREQAVEQFKKQSIDANYLSRLNNYISDKEKQLTEENNKSLQLRNINYLKRQSDEILKKISKDNVSEEEGERMVSRMVEEYKANGVGDNKYQLLTHYLQIVNPAIYKAIGERDHRAIKAELERQKMEKKKLSNQIRDLQRQQRENSEKCCEVM